MIALHITDIFTLNFCYRKKLAFLPENLAFAGFAILPLQRCTVRCQNVLAPFQQLSCLMVSCFLQAFLLVLADFAHDLVIEVLDDMEIIEDHPQVRALFLESFLEVRVHIKGNGFHMRHPFQPDMLDEIVDDLLLLSLGNPKNVAVRHVDDVGRVFVSVVQFELVDAKEPRMLFWAAKLSVFDVKFLEAALVNSLHDVLADTGKLADLLVGELVAGKKEADILFQLLRDAVMIRLKRDFLHVRMAAGWADVLDVLEADTCGTAANDLERVTKSAYAMVVYYGMSDKMPNISYYDSTGQDYGFTKPYGEERAAIIDKEVSRIVSEQYERAKELLRKHAEGHNQLTEVLLSREVIYTEDVERIFGKRQWESRTDEILRLNEEARRKESESSDEPKSESDSQNAAADDSTSISTPPEIPADCK